MYYINESRKESLILNSHKTNFKGKTLAPIGEINYMKLMETILKMAGENLHQVADDIWNIIDNADETKISIIDNGVESVEVAITSSDLKEIFDKFNREFIENCFNIIKDENPELLDIHRTTGARMSVNVKIKK